MRMPGFVADTPVSTMNSAFRSVSGSGIGSGVVPQASCSISKLIDCFVKASACIPLCMSGNIPGCIACLAKDAPDCIPCLAG